MLVSLGVILGFFVLNWARGMTEERGVELTERADYSALCSSIGARIDSVCQNTQTLNMNITNNNNLDIDSIMVGMIDIYGSPQLRELNTTIKPGEKKEIKVVKQGIIQKMDFSPATFSRNKRIVCQNKRVSIESVPIC